MPFLKLRSRSEVKGIPARNQKWGGPVGTPLDIPVLDLALGLDLQPKPVGEPPRRLLGGKSPELYSGT